MSEFIRGSSVFVDVVFKDKAGAVVEPAAAELTINFPKSRSARGNVTIALAAAKGFAGGWGLAEGLEDGDQFAWDSRVAAPGVVYAHARTGDADGAIESVDFDFVLTANEANISANA